MQRCFTIRGKEKNHLCRLHFPRIWCYVDLTQPLSVFRCRARRPLYSVPPRVLLCLFVRLSHRTGGDIVAQAPLSNGGLSTTSTDKISNVFPHSFRYKPGTFATWKPPPSPPPYPPPFCILSPFEFRYPNCSMVNSPLWCC